VAAVAAGVIVASRALAQHGSSRMGGPDPGSMFSTKHKDAEEVSGPSLTATDEPVAAIRVEGNRSIPTSQILREIQTRVGRPFDPALVQRDVRKLASRSWFVDVEPKVEQTPEGRVVTFRVVERPVIRYVQYLGNEGIKDKKLVKETGLKIGGSVDPYAVEEARRKMVALYHTNGYNDVQITIAEGTKATDRGIVYVINEGTPQKVWDVEFIGNEFVSGRRLKTQIESKPPILMVFKGYVDREKVDGDVQRLVAYYRSFGFFQAKVGRTLTYNEKGNWLTLTFVIHEGPRYQVRNVKFMGNQLFADDSLAMGVKLPSQQPFEQAKMNGDVEWLKELYGSQGYVFADIRAEPIFLEEPGQLDLVYHIEEGKQWRVGRIFVHIDGENPHTRIQTALNRISLRPGEIMDIREVRASERRLQASSLFLADPAKGIMPKITYRIQELDETQLAGAGDNVRGQSPDDVAPQSTYRPAPGGQTYEVRRPVSEVENAIDVLLEFDDSAAAASAPTSPTAQPYVVRKPPYDDDPANEPQQQPAASAYQALNIRGQNPYQAIAPRSPAGDGPSVRLQSPYPSVAPQTYPTGTGYSYNSTTYNQQTYGGQAVGATGPDAAPVGYGTSSIRTAAITEPQLPPAQGASTAPTVATPQTGQSYPAAAAPTPVGPAYPTPATALAPDPRITPLPANPLIFPDGPVDPFAPPNDPAADLLVDLSETQTGRLMLGVAVNSDAGLVGQVLIDEQNFDWRRYPRTMDELVNGRAFRGAGQRFRLEAAPGTEMQRYLASFQEPYLWDTPISLGLSGSYYDRQYYDWDEQRLGGRVSLGYQWTANDLSAAIAYRGENVNIRNIRVAIPELLEVEGDNVLHGFRLTVANDTRDSGFLATTGHYAEFSVEQVIGSFVYSRADLDIRQYALMYERPDHSGRHVLSYSARLGFTTDDTPVYDRYFAGGYSTMRGFDFRGASPVKQGVRIGGDFEWLNTLEYLFPLTADDMMHGVAFVDYGSVAENVTLKDIRVAPGFGLRITVPAMGPAPIALDFSWPVASAPYDDKQVFSFSIGLQR
jgi:outer membrane protein insertion porin family